uniref:Proteophosphoglycan ppg4 n=1 Tax=Mycena chlorophos TaxID=658473 RepID=A0ABQ0L412_MYCCL|nr:predicted protein [Mycena chlorophos]
MTHTQHIPVPMSSRKTFRLWASGNRQLILDPHLEDYIAARARGPAAERRVLRRILLEFFTRVPWHLSDDDEPELTPYDPNAIVEPEVLTPEQVVERDDRVRVLTKVLPFTCQILTISQVIQRVRGYFKYRSERTLNLRRTFGRDPTKDPYARLVIQLSGYNPPRRARQPFQQFMKEKYATDIAPIVQTRWSQQQQVDLSLVGRLPKAGFRAEVAKDLFRTLPVAERDGYALRAQTIAQQEKEAYKQALRFAPSTEPVDRLAAINRLPDFIGPILQEIYNVTGWHATLVAGGPHPELGGRIGTTHVCFGRNLTVANQHWAEYDTARFDEDVLGFFGEYLKTAYSESQCAASALPNHQPRVNSGIMGNGVESDLDSDSSPEIDTDDSEDSDFEDIAPPAKRTRQTGALPASTGSALVASTSAQPSASTSSASASTSSASASASASTRRSASRSSTSRHSTSTSSVLAPSTSASRPRPRPRPLRRSGAFQSIAPDQAGSLLADPAALATPSGLGQLADSIPLIPLSSHFSTQGPGPMDQDVPMPLFSDHIFTWPPPISSPSHVESSLASLSPFMDNALPLAFGDSSTSLSSGPVSTSLFGTPSSTTPSSNVSSSVPMVNPPPLFSSTAPATSSLGATSSGMPTHAISTSMASTQGTTASRLALQVLGDSNALSKASQSPPAVQSPPINATPPVIPTPAVESVIPARLPLSAPTTIVPGPVAAGPSSATMMPLPPVGVQAPLTTRRSLRSTTAVPDLAQPPAMPADAPLWFSQTYTRVVGRNLGPGFNAVLNAWVRIEVASRFLDSDEGLVVKGRPAVLTRWLRATSESGDLPEVENVASFRATFTRWCDGMQPNWRQRDSSKRWIIGGTYGAKGREWGALYTWGSNGLVAVVAGLFIWGCAAQGTTHEVAWTQAVDDAGWIMEGMAAYYELFNKRGKW